MSSYIPPRFDGTSLLYILKYQDIMLEIANCGYAIEEAAKEAD
jgi:hypothetical protein